MKNGTAGMPGKTPRPKERNETIPSALGCPPNCLNSAVSVAPVIPALVTTKPADVDTISAGICDTSPSPTVNRV